MNSPAGEPTGMLITQDIFVFGSNRQGRHGRGAARYAVVHHGAIYGQAEGLQGTSYAIITKELRSGFSPVTLEEVAGGVQRFLAFAWAHPEYQFTVSPIGCGLAGFTPGEIGPLFRGCPPSVDLPDEFKI